MCCLEETHLCCKDAHTDSEGIEKLFPANGNQKKAGVAVLTWDKINRKTKTVIRDKEGHYIMKRVSIQQEDIMFVNIYAHSVDTPKYIHIDWPKRRKWQYRGGGGL